MIYIDTERKLLVTESKIKSEFDLLQKENPQEYDYSFSKYLENCCGKNGFLRRLT